jgi:hypothetical protein
MATMVGMVGGELLSMLRRFLGPLIAHAGSEVLSVMYAMEKQGKLEATNFMVKMGAELPIIKQMEADTALPWWQKQEKVAAELLGAAVKAGYTAVNHEAHLATVMTLNALRALGNQAIQEIAAEVGMQASLPVSPASAPIAAPPAAPAAPAV